MGRHRESRSFQNRGYLLLAPGVATASTAGLPLPPASVWTTTVRQRQKLLRLKADLCLCAVGRGPGSGFRITSSGFESRVHYFIAKPPIPLNPHFLIDGRRRCCRSQFLFHEHCHVKGWLGEGGRPGNAGRGAAAPCPRTCSLGQPAASAEMSPRRGCRPHTHTSRGSRISWEVPPPPHPRASDSVIQGTASFPAPLSPASSHHARGPRT